MLRITTVLSLAGVLSAGSAAAVLNNQVLDNNTGANSNNEVTIDAAATGNGAAVDVAINSATQIYSNALSPTQLMFQIGSAGVVTLDTAGNTLTVVSATASDGWAVVQSETNGSADVAVNFQSANDLVEFTANRLADGSVVTAVESANASDDTATADTTGTSSTGRTGTTTGNTSGDPGQGTDDRGGDDANGTDDSTDDSGHGDADDCAGGATINVCIDADVDVSDD